MSRPYSGSVYNVQTVTATPTTTATSTLITIKAAVPIWILRFSVTQKGSTTSVQERVQLIRKTTADTVTSFTPLLYDPGDTAAASVGGTAATGINSTAEGTLGDIIVDRGFNVLNGVEWIATPMEMTKVLAGGWISLRFAAVPSAVQNWVAQVIFAES